MKKIILIIIIILICMVPALNLYLRQSLLKDDEVVYLMAHPGDSFSRVLKRLDSLNLSFSPLVAKSYVKLYGFERKIYPGRYTIGPKTSRLDLLRHFKDGAIDYVWITLPEGLTVDGTIRILAQESGRAPNEFRKIINDSSFLAGLPFSPTNIEGYLFPDTYKVPYYVDPDYLIISMVKSLKVFLDSSRITGTEKPEFTVHALLTFASLIEAETTDRLEMPLIASVFHNRLDKNMLLQCDPTVIYAMGGLDRPLQLRDLDYDSPYNTYLHKGLPPGPINSPGRDAIMAALYPADTDYFYFVADINGKHIFSKTNAEHEKNRREIKGKKRIIRFKSDNISTLQAGH